MVFCQTYREQKRRKPQRRLEGDYTFTFFGSAADVHTQDWETATGKKNIFLELGYLSLIEELHKGPVSSKYILVYHKKMPVLAAYFQVVDFTADVFGDLVVSQISELQSQRLKLFDKYVNKYRDQVIMRLVTCGNNFVSGEHGFAWSDKLKKEEAFSLLTKVTEIVAKEEKLRGTISAILVKDFYTSNLPQKDALAENKFIEFTVEPNMIFSIPPSVNSVSEYIALFSKKYRNRAKGILKAGMPLERRDLSVEEVRKFNVHLYKLYNQVFSNAKFKLVKLSENYFAEMKRSFPDNFFVTAYFLDSKLVGFDSGFLLEDEVEAHYIGLDYEVNKSYELYQNILYHFIELSILHKKKHLNLGRTASEIKSTVGAKARELVCYIKPQNTVSKVILKPFISFLQPTEWIPRNPFKEE
jgi:hypothetical protein